MEYEAGDMNAVASEWKSARIKRSVTEQKEAKSALDLKVRKAKKLSGEDAAIIYTLQSSGEGQKTKKKEKTKTVGEKTLTTGIRVCQMLEKLTDRMTRFSTAQAKTETIYQWLNSRNSMINTGPRVFRDYKLFCK